MKKKVYAVKKGRSTGIFDSWDACREQVDGYPGALYKSFSTRQEALEYLGPEAGEDAETVFIVPPAYIPQEGHITAYVDGSYRHDLRKYAFGCVLLLPDGSCILKSGSGDREDSAKLRNVTGEMLGAMTAVQWCLQNGYHALDLYYDYLGIEMWACGKWKTNLDLTGKYAAYMQEKARLMEIRFHKVKAHTGDLFNEKADQLAKKALEEKTLEEKTLDEKPLEEQEKVLEEKEPEE